MSMFQVSPLKPWQKPKERGSLLDPGSSEVYSLVHSFIPSFVHSFVRLFVRFC